MAITENDGIVQIIATGGESELDFDFKLLVRSDLRVLRSDTELTLDLHYTVPDESLNDDSGGTIVLDAVTYFPDGATAGDIFTLILDPPCEREGDFQPGDGITRWQTHNSEYDRIWQYLQKLTRDVSRSALVDETELGLNLSLPLPEEGSFIGW
ncbi:MAG: hypothetical protein HGA87_01450, partial [Desulfobulbaceae bacterium]|nr:hypothetical protein [Desulfobulbaceae bacterium]